MDTKNLVGQRFNRWLVVESAPRVRWGDGKAVRTAWWCLCECRRDETRYRVSSYALLSGRSQQCRKCSSEGASKHAAIALTKHGHNSLSGGRKPTPTYQSWYAMRARCTNPKNKRYDDYAGRGITVCERWKSFENFLADMGERPIKMTLDRIDVNGNYEPSNCRWADAKTQANNKRKLRVLDKFTSEEIQKEFYKRKLDKEAAP